MLYDTCRKAAHRERPESIIRHFTTALVKFWPCGEFTWPFPVQSIELRPENSDPDSVRTFQQLGCNEKFLCGACKFLSDSMHLEHVS